MYYAWPSLVQAEQHCTKSAICLYSSVNPHWPERKCFIPVQTLLVMSIIFYIEFSCHNHYNQSQSSATVLHSLVIHLDDARGMVVPAHLHLAGLLPLLLVVQPAQNLISDIAIMISTT